MKSANFITRLEYPFLCFPPTGETTHSNDLGSQRQKAVHRCRKSHVCGLGQQAGGATSLPVSAGHPPISTHGKSRGQAASATEIALWCQSLVFSNNQGYYFHINNCRPASPLVLLLSFIFIVSLS